MKAYIFGHSHMWAIQRALTESGGRPDMQLILCGTAQFPGSLVYANVRSGNILLNAALLSALHRAGAQAEEDVLVSGVQGNQSNAIGLLTDGAPFEVHLPGWPRPPASGVPLLPFRAVREMLAEELSEFDTFCDRLKRLGYRKFVHLASPPPIPDSEFIRSKLPPLPSGQEPDIAAADLRLKLWTIQTDLLAEIVKRNGGQLLRPPPETVDSDGFLKPDYWKDSVHANGAYAKLQLEQIEGVLEQMKQPAE